MSDPSTPDQPPYVPPPSWEQHPRQPSEPEPAPTPPPLPPLGTRIDPLANAHPTPAEQAQAPAQAAVGATGAPSSAPSYEQAVADAGLSSHSGTIERSFKSRRVADSVILHVDEADYRCASSAPSDRLVDAVEAQESRNQYALILALRRLIASVMYPEDRARYEARCADAVTETLTNPETGVEEPVDLAPIDPVDMIAHGLWLVEVYFARPTAPSVPSGAGR